MSAADIRLARIATSPMRWLAAPRFYGLDNIPAERPLMFVGNHTMYGIFDAPILITELFAKTGIALRGVGDHLHFQIPGWRSLVSRYGVVDGTRENCAELLGDRQCLLVFPGGAGEVAKRRDERYKLVWKNRVGFAQVAIDHGATIVPVASVGIDDAFEIWRDKDDIVARFGDLIDRLDIRRDAIMPIARRWHAERLYFRFGAPIRPADLSEHGAAKAFELRANVRTSVEDGIDWLLRERDRDPNRFIGARIRRTVARLLGAARHVWSPSHRA